MKYRIVIVLMLFGVCFSWGVAAHQPVGTPTLLARTARLGLVSLLPDAGRGASQTFPWRAGTPGRATLAPLASLTVDSLTVDSLTVDSLTVDSLIDGAPANDGRCTLREALLNANGNDQSGSADCAAGSGADTINFNVTGTINLTGVLPVLSQSVTIAGPGANLLTVRRDTGGDYRIFNIPGSGLNIAISGLTISQGKASGVFVNDNFGGGIYSASPLTLTDCVVTQNEASTGGGGVMLGAAGMFTGCVFSDNTGRQGGGINFEGRNGAMLTLVNCTLNGNRANEYGSGGGILHFNTSGQSTLDLVNCTLAGNTSTTTNGGGILTNGLPNSATTRLRNTLLADNTVPSLVNGNSTVLSLGHNLASDDGGGFLNQPTDLINRNPLLAPLADNGGPTPTHALLPGSPALEAGDNCVLTDSCASDNLGFNLTTDQRGTGFNRQAGSTVDIGAYEVSCSPTFTVVTTADTPDAQPGDSLCADANGNCSLRAALTEANALPACGTLTIHLPAGTYTQTLVAAADENTNAGGDWDIAHNVVIRGAGAGTTILQAATTPNTATERVFDILSGTVEMGDLTVRYGKPLYVGRLEGGGGGIVNHGKLTLQRVVVSQNITDGAFYFGGGISSFGALTLTDCAIVGNQAKGQVGGGGVFLAADGTFTGCNISGNTSGYQGGGIDFQGQDGQMLRLLNCTISGNTANRLDTINGGAGGGVYIFSHSGASTLEVTNCTIADNRSATTQGGGLSAQLGLNSTATTRLRNTIIANNTEPNLYKSLATPNKNNITSLGHNLTSDNGSGLLTGSGDLINTDPLLAPLGDYGGPTQTHALLPGSPALDRGDNCVLTNSCASDNLGFNLTTDQRGFNRQIGSTVDIGAFESRGFTLAVASGNNQTTPVTQPFANPLTALVSSAFNEPVAGGVVTFTAPGSGPSTTLSGNPATIGANGRASVGATANSVTGTYQVQARVSATGPTVNFTLTNTCAPITVTSVQPVEPTCPGGANGSLTVQASGGIAPLQYSINHGQSFQTSNVFAGLAAGSYTIVVKDANGCPSAPFPATLLQPAALSLSPGALPTIIVGQALSQLFTASGGTGAKSISLQGTLPNWLSFTAATATLSGTAPTPATVSFTLVVTDQQNCTASFPYTLNFVCPAVTLAPVNLPAATVNTAYPTTLTASPAGTAYSFALTSGLLPNGLTLNGDGTFSGAPVQSGTFNFRVTASGWGTCSGFRDYVLLVNCPGVTLNPASLPGGTLGTAYNQSVSASPAGSYSYRVTSGALPGGLTLNPANGVITGTPTASGTYSFTIAATAGTCAGSQSYTVTIVCSGVSFTTTTLPGAQAGVAYSQTLGVNPAGSYTFSLVTGNLPPGFTLNAATGVISGMATATGSYSFTVQALAVNGCGASQGYTLIVACPTVTVNPVTLPNGTSGAAYNQSLSATPGGNYSFSKTSGSLPPGLSLSAAGSLSGNPTTQGSYSFTVTATGFGSCSGSRQYTLTITASCATITLPTLPATGKVGVNYSGNLAATTPSASYTFTVESGALPPGLAINNLFGQLSGKPTAAGEYTFTLKAARSNGCTGTREYTVTINSGTALRTALARTADYDGDGRSDLSLWSESSGRWQIVRSSDEQTTQTAWGAAGDLTLLGDYDGDGLSDLAVFRPGNATFYIKRSSAGSALVKPWGLATDVPVPGDYDGDGQTDVAVWRPSEGNWYILKSSDGGYLVKAWGLGSAPYLDVPVPGDYDGDGKTDLAVFRRSSGTWLIQRSADGQYTSKTWGVGTDVPVTGDYDGDGKSDLAVWRGATGQWFVLRSSDQGYESKVWGAASVGDVPAPGDYDGDGQADLAVWRAPEGHWYVWQSGPQDSLARSQGQAGDRPVANH
jgi:CSLREA domain-containing protein